VERRVIGLNTDLLYSFCVPHHDHPNASPPHHRTLPCALATSPARCSAVCPAWLDRTLLIALASCLIRCRGPLTTSSPTRTTPTPYGVAFIRLQPTPVPSTVWSPRRIGLSCI
jgi:hypothetical protein